MKKKYYFLGKDEEKIIRLFSVEERTNSKDTNVFDLVLFFPGRGLFRTNSNIGELIKDVVDEDYKKTSDINGGPHITVHYHPGHSSIFINRTTATKQGCKITGIKDGKLFAPVILKLFGTTKSPMYSPKIRHLSKSIETNISFNSNTDTLVMFFLVSKNRVKFNKDPEYPANYIEKDFTNFRLTIIYRFFSMPPETPTINLFLNTPPGDTHTIMGLEWWQTCNLLNDLETAYATEYFKKHPERNKPYLSK